MKIRIASSELKGYWYYNLIGKVFDAELRESGNSYVLTDTEHNRREVPSHQAYRLDRKVGAKLGVFARNAEIVMENNKHAKYLLEEDY